MKSFTLKVYRGVPGKQYWESFVLPLVPFANVISSLMEIQKSPINNDGEKVEPVVWEQGCLEEVCGSCSMLINGRPCQACTALIEPILKKTGGDTITLAPFTKFPLVRDLIVDRTTMFENLKKVHSWVEVDSTHDRGPGPLVDQKTQQLMYSLSRCMTCGCCSESCPQVNEHSKFMGPAPIAQVHLFNAHPTGAMTAEDRLDAMSTPEGVASCGNAQNCVKVCPKGLPLTQSIGAIGRQVSLQFLRNLIG